MRSSDPCCFYGSDPPQFHMVVVPLHLSVGRRGRRWASATLLGPLPRNLGDSCESHLSLAALVTQETSSGGLWASIPPR